MTSGAQGTGLPARLARSRPVEPFRAMDIMAKANRRIAAGEDVALLCVGQPDAPAPSRARAAAAAMLREGRIGYTDATGRADLREAIALDYERRHGIVVDPARIVVTTGSSAGFSLAFLAMLEPGERIGIAWPGYPAYRNIARALDLRPVELRTTAQERHAITPRLVAEAHEEEPLAAVLVASPANPTGTMMDADALRALRDACAERGIALISDEIYHGLSLPGAPEETTMLAIDDAAVVINSFSKYYCMTGWRVGWMVVPESLVRAVERVAQNLYISAPDASQIGATHAFDGTGELEAVRRGYAENRSLLLRSLPELGFRLAARSDGAFYAWCDVSGLTNDAMAFSRRMLNEAGVAAPPGHDFDPIDGVRTMRFSYAGSHENVTRAVERLRRWLG